MVGTIFGLENIEKRKENYSLVTHDIIENADICVIGSGAAGAILAAKLSAKGKTVVLLEKGGYYDAEDMNQREVDMMPLLWKNGGANFTDNLRIIIAQGQCLGGSTVINDAVCFRTPLIVRNQWRQMGVDISDEQWDKAIDEVWSEIHVNKVTEEELNNNNLMLKKACYQSGYMASENDRNCIDCRRCGFCHLGCHYDTKQSMLVTYIHRALENPVSNLKIYCNCGADKVTYSNEVVTGVEGNFIDSTGQGKYKIRINAKVVVISAGAIASSQILMKNNIAEGKAGKGLGLHPGPFLLGRFDQEIKAYDGIPMAYSCHEFGVTNGKDDGGFLIESIFVPMFQLSLGLPSFFEGFSRLMQDYIHYAMAVVLIRDESNGEITLSDKGNPIVHYRLSEKDISNMANGLKILAQMWFDVGAQHVISGHEDIITLNGEEDIPRLVEAVTTNPDGLWLASGHPQGGNRMGHDESNCVVNSNCKVHGFSNLYVCDASVFPTTLGVNPQITVMALAIMTADNINNVWDSQYDKLNPEKSLGETCSIKQPMYCSTERLITMFHEVKNDFPVENLINATGNDSSEERWSFDKNTLMIYNNIYWKGFYPTDKDLAFVRYFGGFWKQFRKENGMIKGIAHQFDRPVFAQNLPQAVTHPGYGEVIYIKYTDPGYRYFYDLLKIVNKDMILGILFSGSPPFGNPISVFSMSRRYSVDFMTEDDHETIYQRHSVAPINSNEILGRWNGRLVSDSTLSPVVQVFTYKENNIEKLHMEYSFGGLLRGISRVGLSEDQSNVYDFTNWQNELKIVRNDLVLGKWYSPWTKIPLNFGPSFLSVDKDPQENERTRFCLRYTLRRN